jgi:hypothetical protein
VAEKEKIWYYPSRYLSQRRKKGAEDVELHEFEEYCRLRNILEQRCEELCHLYAQIYFDLEGMIGKSM